MASPRVLPEIEDVIEVVDHKGREPLEHNVFPKESVVSSAESPPHRKFPSMSGLERLSPNIEITIPPCHGAPHIKH